MKMIFICHSFESKNLDNLIESFSEQSNKKWKLYLITDENLNLQNNNDDNINHVKLGAVSKLSKIIECARKYENQEDVVVSVFSGLSYLCNERTVSLILKEYQNNEELDTLWTANTLQLNGTNLSRSYPDLKNLSPYQFPWVSSNLMTWRATILKKVSDANYKDIENLYLPILYVSKKKRYIDDTCFLYTSDNFLLDMKHEEENKKLVNFVRARGFVDE